MDTTGRQSGAKPWYDWVSEAVLDGNGRGWTLIWWLWVDSNHPSIMSDRMMAYVNLHKLP